MRTFLYLTHEIPWPPDAGHKVRGLQIIDALSKLGRVHVAGYTELPETVHEGDHGVAGVLAQRQDLRLRRRPARLALALATSFMRGEPYWLSKFADRTFSSDLAALIEAARPDCIVATLVMLQTLPASVFDQGPPVILDSHNIEHQFWEDFAVGAPVVMQPFMWRERVLLRAREHAAWMKVDGVIAICDEDAAVIARRSAEPPVVVPVVLPEVQPRSLRSGARAFDVGMVGVWSWAPNQDGLAWFAEEILPELRQRGLSVGIAGKGISAAMGRRLRRQGATLLGYVENLAAFYDSVKVIAAPYRRGGGVRMKVAEAIGHGVPVVGTPLAFRGLVGLDMPQAATAAQMIDQLDALARSPGADVEAQVRRTAALHRHSGELGDLAVARLMERVLIPS